MECTYLDKETWSPQMTFNYSTGELPVRDIILFVGREFYSVNHLTIAFVSGELLCPLHG